MAKLFLTDYASYNNGTQFEFGHWVDLEEYSDAEEFMEYVTEHLEECNEKSPIEGSTREEPMFTDYEDLPENLYGESLSLSDLEKIYNYIEEFGDVDDNDESFWGALHSEYCSENNTDDEIYENDDDFFDNYFSKTADAVRAAIYGDYNYSHNYVVFNGYGNLESFNDIFDHIDRDELISWKLSNM